MTDRRSTPPHRPSPAGHYSPVVSGAGLLFVSGQLPTIVDGAPLSHLFEAQATSAIENLLRVLRSAGAEPCDLVKVTAYIVGAHRWAAFNEAYAATLGPSKPARTVVPVSDLHYGCLVEIDAIAVQPQATAGTNRP